jgi:hypothetical protein
MTVGGRRVTIAVDEWPRQVRRDGEIAGERLDQDL